MASVRNGLKSLIINQPNACVGHGCFMESTLHIDLFCRLVAFEMEGDCPSEENAIRLAQKVEKNLFLQIQ